MTLIWQQANALDLRGQQKSFYFADIPTECPICHVQITGQTISGYFLTGYEIEVEGVSLTPIEIAYRCNNSKCASVFVVTYHRRFAETPPKGLSVPEWWEIGELAPKKPIGENFPEAIREASPTFVEIYNQAIAAEAQNLSHIAGMGLRKALEFLIKDFLIKQEPKKADEIKKAALGTCIKERIEDPKIKLSAQRATWIGNDETHYERKWPDKDIKDLKILIRLTVNWIESLWLTDHYSEGMKIDPKSIKKPKSVT